MLRRSIALLASGAAIALGALVLPPSVQAQDFFSALFGGLEGGRWRGPAMAMPMPFASERGLVVPQNEFRRPRVISYGQAFCVRTCDGRYFPVTGPDNQSRASSCNSFCPASETKVVYGSNIDDAATETGKPYSELPNAFRYRNEIVAGCTCNGKDQVGLAPNSVENDPTLRKGGSNSGASGSAVA